MVYITYEQFLVRYQDTQKLYNEILSEKEALFQQTQPQAIRYDKEKVIGGKAHNLLEEYVERKEEKRIDERLAEVKSLLEDRELLLKLKLDELRGSNYIEDKIYLMRYIERIRVFRIAKILNYSKSQVYRILDQIEKKTGRCDKMRQKV